jgi:hypothetical protein
MLLLFLKYALHLTTAFHYCCTHLKFDIFPDLYRAMFIYGKMSKIGLLRNFMWTFRKILKFKNGVSRYACTRVSVSIKVRFTWFKANGLYVQIKERCTLQQQCKTGGLQLDTNNKVIIFWLENGKNWVFSYMVRCQK